jgi:hypothetical protein
VLCSFIVDVSCHCLTICCHCVKQWQLNVRQWNVYNKVARRRQHNLQTPLKTTVQQDAKMYYFLCLPRFFECSRPSRFEPQTAYMRIRCELHAHSVVTARRSFVEMESSNYSCTGKLTMLLYYFTSRYAIACVCWVIVCCTSVRELQCGQCHKQLFEFKY